MNSSESAEQENMLSAMRAKGGTQTSQPTLRQRYAMWRR